MDLEILKSNFGRVKKRKKRAGNKNDLIYGNILESLILAQDER